MVFFYAIFAYLFMASQNVKYYHFVKMASGSSLQSSRVQGQSPCCAPNWSCSGAGLYVVVRESRDYHISTKPAIL